ncbi:hypothetical protein [Metabacillus fastidiosus]|uniref:hypothetical protein n=1 Tax=Metabacillus fastidiosus TaxID=1458 RepID=UPI003D26EDFD
MENLPIDLLLTSEFTGYIAIAFLLFVIRNTEKVPNNYIPIIAVILGIGFSAFEATSFNFEIMLKGLEYAALGIATVASWKYIKEKREDK